MYVAVLAGFVSFNLELSVVEIYNEQVRDIRRADTDSIKQPGVTGSDDWWKYTNKVKIISMEHAMEEIQKAYQQRVVRSTAMNEVSSRSHCIISVLVKQSFSYSDITDSAGFHLHSRVNLVDLAGSERGRTRKLNDQSDCISAQEEEAININKSLLVLNKVISNLSDGKIYAPFGESKLTRLLKNSLGGNAFTVLVVNLSPSAKDYGETLSSLEYAKRAKRIQNKISQNAKDIMLHEVAVASMAWAPVQNLAELSKPVRSATTYRILFVAANSINSTKLKVEIEKRVMKDAFVCKYGDDRWGDSILFLHTFWKSKSDLPMDLSQYDPIILHFSCHGHKSALSLFEQDLAAQDLEEFIASWTVSEKSLRVVIANGCHNDYIVQALCKHVDFVIGHATPVDDEDAVAFARVLYGHLGAGESLEMAFDAARLVCNLYRMNGLGNAAKFKLYPDNDLVRFLENEGLGSVAIRFSEEMGMDSKKDLAHLQPEDLDDPQFCFLHRWQKEKLLFAAHLVVCQILGHGMADSRGNMGKRQSDVESDDTD